MHMYWYESVLFVIEVSVLTSIAIENIFCVQITYFNFIEVL